MLLTGLPISVLLASMVLLGIDCTVRGSDTPLGKVQAIGYGLVLVAMSAATKMVLSGVLFDVADDAHIITLLKAKIIPGYLPYQPPRENHDWVASIEAAVRVLATSSSISTCLICPRFVPNFETQLYLCQPAFLMVR